MAEQTYVVVGAGLAGAKAVEALREKGFEGRVVLVGAEPERPYERPPLSKGYLLGNDERSSIFVHDEQWYDEHAVELLTGRRATGLDLDGRTVELDDGERVGFTRLLLATGASPRRLGSPGADLAGVHTLRTVADSEALQADLTEGRHLVVVGGGWIGLEVAAAARSRGVEVTVVEPQPVPLVAALGPEMGQVFVDLHREHGVDLRLGRGVGGLRGNGRVEAVLTDEGSELPADLVVVGIGAVPAAELAERAGLAVDNGVLVDASLRTDHPDVFAAGDVANAVHPFYDRRIRVEHWNNALHQGPVAAASMLGEEASYDRLPYFFTDQYDLGMEFTGWFAPGGYDEVVTRGDVAGRSFQALWLDGGRAVAAMHVNQWDEGIAPLEALVKGRAEVDRDRFTDTGVALADL